MIDIGDCIFREAVAEFIHSYRCSTDVAFHMEQHLNEIPAAEGGVSMEEYIFAAVTLLIGFFFGFLCGRSGA